MAEIKISVIIPIYNMERYLEESLNSVLNQTMNEIEIICVDDGSTDGSLEILRRYKENNECLKILIQKNQGSGAARNAGIGAARGEFVAFMDPDDYYADNDVLEYLYTCAKRERVNLCGGGVIYEREGKILQSKGKADSFATNEKIEYKYYQHICGYTAFIFKRKLLIEHSIYFPNYRRFQDVPFIVNVMIHAKFFYAVSKSIYVYRMVDKLIPYHDENVINGIAQGIDDVVRVSGKARFETLHTDIVEKLMESYIDWFYKSIYDGNKILKEILQKIWNDIDEELLLQDGRIETKPIFKSEEEINDYISKNRENKEKFWKHISCFKRIIIYGAGVAGKRLFKFIISNGYEGMVEFAVSDLNPEGTACGKQIRSIDSYIKYKNDALVIIAVKENGHYMMLDRAKKLGYCNIESADYKVISF